MRSALRITGVLVVLVFGLSHWQSYWSRHPPPTWAPYSLTSSRTPRIQHDFPESAGADVHRLQAVKEEFIHAYAGYKNHAWLRDEVKPLSGGSHTQYCGWALTLVDTLDTLYLMGMYDEFEEGVQAVTKMNFFFSSTIFCGINPFEMTIRHLGGLLSAYDISGARDDRLKKKAVQMGEMLLRAFGANGMHCRQIIWPRIPGWPCKPSSMLPLARLGSQSLEFIRLSMVSGRPTWADKIQFFAQEMERIQETSFLPGLWPKFVDGSCPKGLCDYDQTETQWFTMGSGTDSTYEYLPKTHLLYGAHNPIYLRMWRRSLTVFRDHMLLQPMAPNNSDLLFPALLRSPNGYTHDFLGKIEHLSCFIGGTIALGARIDPSASSNSELDLAAKLTNACVWAYETSPTGIMPDTFWVLPCPDSPLNCPWNPAVFEDKVHQSHPHPTANTTIPLGFAQIDDPKYMLRPEAIESVFMLYRITGDQRWREKGWRMFQSIRKATRTRLAHAGLSDTLTPGAAKIDKMESFWLSETLKYFYLLFADPRVLSLDEWVFNTEAHPFKLQDDSRGFG